jgi:hypothetical protein
MAVSPPFGTPFSGPSLSCSFVVPSAHPAPKASKTIPPAASRPAALFQKADTLVFARSSENSSHDADGSDAIRKFNSEKASLQRFFLARIAGWNNWDENVAEHP